MKPSSDPRNANYTSIFVTTDLAIVPPQIDWMMLFNIRDCENWVLDFEGNLDEGSAVSTSASEYVGWYNAMGFLSSVKYDEYTFTDPSVATLQAIKKTDTNGIALYIKITFARNGWRWRLVDP